MPEMYYEHYRVIIELCTNTKKKRSNNLLERFSYMSLLISLLVFRDNDTEHC